MANGNPFFVQAADYSNSLNSLAQGIGNFGQMQKQKQEEQMQIQQQEDQKVRMGELQEIVKLGDLDKVADFMLANPDMSNNVQRNIFGAMGIKDDIQKDQLKADTFKMLSNPESIEQNLTQRIATIQARGGDPSHTVKELEAYKQSPQKFLQGLEGLASSSFSPEYKTWSKAMRGDQQAKPFQMGTGQMSGYNFDPNTGEYSINPEVKAQFTAKATAKAAEGVKLGAKDRLALNKDVTALLKDTVAVNKAANSLKGLKKSSSAAAKLAAVFSFMKSLDPTSVVRESEQGQVYAAEGAASALAGKLNSLMGEGQLTDVGFQDLVNTADNLANSAITASGTEVQSYLDTYEDTIPAKFKEALFKRIPKIAGQQIAKPKQKGAQVQPQAFTSSGGTQFTVKAKG